MNLVPNRQRWSRQTLAIAMVTLLLPCLSLLAGQKKSQSARKSSVHHRRPHSRRYRSYRHVRIELGLGIVLQRNLAKG